jgi:hypothetical protein
MNHLRISFQSQMGGVKKAGGLRVAGFGGPGCTVIGDILFSAEFAKAVVNAKKKRLQRGKFLVDGVVPHTRVVAKAAEDLSVFSDDSE